MPFYRPNISTLLAYIVIGLTLSAMLFVAVSISTAHWIHTKQIRGGLWTLCHVQPLACFHSITRSPAALSLTGLGFILLAFASTLIFDILDWHLLEPIRSLSLISVGSLGLGAFFLSMSYTAFARLTAQFGYSLYLMIVAQLFTTMAAIVAGYLQGRRHILTCPSVFMTRLEIRRT